MTVEAKDFDDNRFVRLSDRILFCLEMAIEQEDVEIAEGLVRVMELAMTRNTGGGEFIERRDYPAEIEGAMNKLGAIKDKQG